MVMMHTVLGPSHRRLPARSSGVLGSVTQKHGEEFYAHLLARLSFLYTPYSVYIIIVRYILRY
jgi:hypothetical protein